MIEKNIKKYVSETTNKEFYNKEDAINDEFFNINILIEKLYENFYKNALIICSDLSNEEKIGLKQLENAIKQELSKHFMLFFDDLKNATISVVYKESSFFNLSINRERKQDE